MLEGYRELPPRGDSNGRSGAGVAEAVIAAALVLRAIGFARRQQRRRTGAQVAVGFAIVGFVLGLTITIPGGSAIDIAYHLTVLPLLVLTLFLLLGAQPRDTANPLTARRAGAVRVPVRQ